MFNPQSDFSKKDPVAKISASWLNKIAAFCKYFQIEIVGGNGITGRITKPDDPSEANPAKITLDFTDADLGGSGGSAELGDATPLTDTGAGAVGTAELASREDHRHPLNAEEADVYGSPSNNYPTKPNSGTGNTGASDKYARADHYHPTLGFFAWEDPPLPASAAGDKGSSPEYSRGNHIHPKDYPLQESSSTQLNAGTATADNTSRTFSGALATGVTLKIHTRTYYDTSLAEPIIYGFYRLMSIDRHGRISSVSAETRYVIANTKLGY